MWKGCIRIFACLRYACVGGGNSSFKTTKRIVLDACWTQRLMFAVVDLLNTTDQDPLGGGGRCQGDHRFNSRTEGITPVQGGEVTVVGSIFWGAQVAAGAAEVGAVPGEAGWPSPHQFGSAKRTVDCEPEQTVSVALCNMCSLSPGGISHGRIHVDWCMYPSNAGIWTGLPLPFGLALPLHPRRGCLLDYWFCQCEVISVVLA